ncbi:hypothetical protein Lser_V15G04878 [Lactuca serriola]
MVVIQGGIGPPGLSVEDLYVLDLNSTSTSVAQVGQCWYKALARLTIWACHGFGGANISYGNWWK